MKVHDILARSAEIWPDKTAVSDKHGEIDYHTLFNEVEAFNVKLRDLGVRPGQGIGVMARNGREFIITVFAVLASGATVLPIFHQVKRGEIDSMLKTTGLHAIIDDGNGVRPVDGDAFSLEIKQSDTMRLTWTGAQREEPFIDFIKDPAFVRFTSGTTGTSKGVVMSNKSILDRIDQANQGLRLSSDDTVLWLLPMAFHFLVSIVLYLREGMTIVVCPDHLAGTILEFGNKYGTTFLYAAPMHYRLLCADTSKTELKTLRLAISTSSAMPPSLSGHFFERYGIPVTQAYGIIELGLPIVNLERALESPGSVGRALPGYEVSILDDALQPLPPGEIGQLSFKGPGMFEAYMSPPEPASIILSNGWFLSGDLAFQDSDGYITVVGRSKSMINVAGNKVFPEEVETVINRYPGVEMSCVYGRPHSHMGEVVHANIVLNEPAGTVCPEDIIRFCRRELTGFKTPQSISVVKEIDRTLSGKTIRDRR